MLVQKSNFETTVRTLAQVGEFGLDVETTGLMWPDRIFSVIISNETADFYFNFNYYSGLYPELILPIEFIKKLQPIFDVEESLFYIHNAKFDWTMLHKEGLRIKSKVWCTQAVSRVIRNNYFPETQYKLEACAARDLGEHKDPAVEEFIYKNQLLTKIQIPGKKKITELLHFDRVPFDIISSYGMKDGRLHRNLGLWQKKELERLAVKHPARGSLKCITATAENEVRLTRTCAKMEHLGIKVDNEYIKDAQEHESKEMHAHMLEFKELTGMPFKDGPKVLSEAFAKFGLKPPGMTAAGNPSFTKELLEDMRNPVADLVNKIRKIEKRLGTYYSSFLYFQDIEQVIHPNMKQAGTTTGRFSYSNPNLQNVPKEEEPKGEGKLYHIRQCFVPREDYAFVMIDFKQQEFRMLLDYAGEHELIEAVNAGADVHQATADLIGISRRSAKTINFGLLYGMGVDKLARSLGIPPEEAQDLKDQYFKKLRGVKKFMRNVQRVVKQQGFICNWHGRVDYLWPHAQATSGNEEYAYTMLNHLIQGGCADVIKIAMNRIDEAFPDLRMLLQVHDELIFETKDFSIVPRIQEIMEKVYAPQNGMRLDTSVEHSFVSWGFRDKVKGLPNE